MNHILLYVTRFCPYCMRAKALLDKKSAKYEAIDIDADPELRQEMMNRAGRYTVPQIWIGDQHIGGCDELYKLEREGKLDFMLGETGN